MDVDALFAVVTLAIVAAGLLVGLYALWEMGPFARHVDRFHEPGQRQDSPHLE